MVVLRTKLQFLIASIPEATRQVIIIVRQNPCILHPGEYTVGTLKAKNLTPPPPTPYPKKKETTMTGKWSNPDLLIPRLARMVITCAIIRDTELASSAMTSVMRRKKYLRRRMLQYGTIIERGLKKTLRNTLMWKLAVVSLDMTKLSITKSGLRMFGKEK